MEFLPSTAADLDAIFELYDMAIAHQKAVSKMHWLPFDKEMVLAEITEGRQWKIILEGQIACVFVTADSDVHIWGEKDKDPAIYLHRIVTNPAFRGRRFVAEIVRWAKVVGKAQGKKYLRLDTWADNQKLKAIYLDCGFEFLGVARPANPDALPSHYSTIELGFFEMDIL